MDSEPLIYISEPPREELLPPAPELEPEPVAVPASVPVPVSASVPLSVPAAAKRAFSLSRKNTIIALVAVVVVLLLTFYEMIAAPTGIDAELIAGNSVSIPSGQGLSSVAKELSTNHVIKSEFALKSMVVIFSGSKGVQAGDYYFSGPENVVRVAWRLTHSLYEFSTVKVTVPEGFASAEIAGLITKDTRLTEFDAVKFKDLAAKREGYLFPDTYFIPVNATAGDIVNMMLANFDARIKPLQPAIATSTRSLSDIIKMASIVEEEGRTTETRKVIAGILWKRLDEGMPLQVDSAFVFVNGIKDSRDLSTADLAIDSPYNTYLYKGLPPTPISNPGLDSILAAIYPEKTPYYFYLSDDQGNMHYAVTLDEHNANKAKYLNY